MQEYIDDTLPLPADVERVFFECAGDGLNAIAWLEEREIDPTPLLKCVGKIAVIDGALAVPIYDGGRFIDMVLIADDCSHSTASGRARWLGHIVPRKTVSLHARPIDWLDAGCVGVCHLPHFSRHALKDLRKARTIECDDIADAFEAWDFGFGAKEFKLKRFVVKDVPSSIRQYFEAEARANTDWRRSRGRR